MKKSIRKKRTNVKIEITPRKLTPHAGNALIEELDKRFSITKTLDRELSIKQRDRGYSDGTMTMSLIHSLSSGGAGISSVEKMRQDEGFKMLTGFPKIPDETTVGEYLRRSNHVHHDQIEQISQRLVRRFMKRIPKSRTLFAKRLEVFLDATHLEVTGKKIEGAAINYEKNLALMWHGLFAGPFLLSERLYSGNTSMKKGWREMIEPHVRWLKKFRPLWYLDSAYYAGSLIETLDQWGFEYICTVNRNKSLLARMASEQPEYVWKPFGKGEEICSISHCPQGWKKAHRYVAIRKKRSGELFYSYYFWLTNCKGMRAAEVVEWHRLKGDRENLFKNLLSDLNLHHPPCLALRANRMFYRIATLTHNMLVGMKLLAFGDRWVYSRIRTIRRNFLLVAGEVVRHARQEVVRLSGFTPYLEDFLEAFSRLRSL